MWGKLQKNMSATGLYEQLVKHQLHLSPLVQRFPLSAAALTRERCQH